MARRRRNVLLCMAVLPNDQARPVFPVLTIRCDILFGKVSKYASSKRRVKVVSRKARVQRDIATSILDTRGFFESHAHTQSIRGTDL